MSDFDTQLAAGDAAIFDQFGDPVRVVRKDGARLPLLRMIINRGEMVDLGDAETREATGEYRIAEAGRLEQEARVEVLEESDDAYRVTGEAFEVNRVLNDDGYTAKHILLPIEC